MWARVLSEDGNDADSLILLRSQSDTDTLVDSDTAGQCHGDRIDHIRRSALDLTRLSAPTYMSTLSAPL